jgi:hypothetical protein
LLQLPDEVLIIHAVHAPQAVGALLLGGEGAKVRLGIIGGVVLARTLLQVPARLMLLPSRQCLPPHPAIPHPKPVARLLTAQH